MTLAPIVFPTAVAGLLLCAGTLDAQRRTVTQEEIDRVHRSALLVDTHNDLPLDVHRGAGIAARRDKGHTDVPRLRQGGVGAVFFAAYVAPTYAAEGKAAHRTLEMIDVIRHDIVGRHPETFRLALSADDIEKGRKEGKIAALIGVEGGYGIEDNLRLLRAFYALGARYLTLTHLVSTGWAGSSADPAEPDPAQQHGLTDFGRELVAEMNRLGMMVDVSHVSDATFWDLLKASRAPLFASHSSCRALSNISRNLSDEMIKAMATRGGVVHINFGCEFLSQKSADGSAWTNPQLRKLAKQGQRGEVPRATLDDVVAHIDHVVRLAGVGAVGIGSDFDGVSCTPLGLEDVSEFPNLTRALLERGYSAEDIRRIYGGNLLRVMRAVERAAQTH